MSAREPQGQLGLDAPFEMEVDSALGRRRMSASVGNASPGIPSIYPTQEPS